MFKCFAATVFVALAPWPAIASTPILSGSYELTTIDLCQIVASVDSKTGQLTVSDPGVQGVETYTMNFDAATMTQTSSGHAIAMTSVYENFSDGTHKGYTTDPYPVSNTGSYSNTATTLTVDAGKGGATYQVTYGQIGGTGIVQNFSGIAVIDKHCFFMLQAQHK